MIIKDFIHAHAEEALALAALCYEEERRHVPALPKVCRLPELTRFADNGLGVAALEGERLVGFLSCGNPWDCVTARVRGVFSPIHAHGAAYESRENIYKRMYQAAAEKWVGQKVGWHAISIYAHDASAVRAFFTYGFGLRCVDAVRPMEPIDCTPCAGYSFCELDPAGIKEILPLKNMLGEHLSKSPMFMYYPPATGEILMRICARRKSRFFCAFSGDLPVAYLEVMDRGENFACDDAGMKNICGAFCLPEHRGRGVYQNLLNFAIAALGSEGYTRLGVDFESFNPNAYGFWLKYFTAYTNSVVRRIDDRIFE